MPQLEILITKTRIIVATFAHFPTKSRLNSIRHSQQCLCKTRLILTKKRLKTRNIRLHLNHLNQTKHLTNLNNAKKKKKLILISPWRSREIRNGQALLQYHHARTHLKLWSGYCSRKLKKLRRNVAQIPSSIHPNCPCRPRFPNSQTNTESKA